MIKIIGAFATMRTRLSNISYLQNQQKKAWRIVLSIKVVRWKRKASLVRTDGSNTLNFVVCNILGYAKQIKAHIISQ